MYNVVVSRSNWLRGTGLGNSSLLNEDLKYCVLGAFCSGRGIEDIVLLNRADLNELSEISDIEPILGLFDRFVLDPDEYEESFAWTQKELVFDIMKVNDVALNTIIELSTQSPLPGPVVIYSEEQREELLTLMFAELGYILEFSD